MNYQPGSFSDSFNTELGKSLWQFLTTDTEITKMIIATDLGYPAVEGIGNDILYRFPQVYKNDRYKQMIGHMIRQILEYIGYTHSKFSIKCTKQLLFSNASLYIKNDYKEVYKNKTIEPVPELLKDGTWNTRVNILTFNENSLDFQHYYLSNTWKTRIEALSASLQLGRLKVDEGLEEK